MAASDRPKRAGWRRWLGIGMLAPLVASGAGCASSLREPVTPLPSSRAVTPPGPEVPPDVAAFAGTWVGQFRTADVPMDHTLVVVRIEKDGDAWRADVLFSHGEQPLWGYSAGYVVTDGTISRGGGLRLRALPDGARVSYVMSLRELKGELVLGGLHAYGSFGRAGPDGGLR